MRRQQLRSFAKLVGETNQGKVPMSKFEPNRYIDYKTMDDRLQIVRRRYVLYSHDISESKCSGIDTLTSGARVTTGLHVYLRKQNKQIEPAFNAL
jgi:hypothetical protein